MFLFSYYSIKNTTIDFLIKTSKLGLPNYYLYKNLKSRNQY